MPCEKNWVTLQPTSSKILLASFISPYLALLHVYSLISVLLVICGPSQALRPHNCNALNMHGLGTLATNYMLIMRVRHKTDNDMFCHCVTLTFELLSA